MELLDAVEVRVLGALIEKEATTPESYPLSLNALVNACNQKSNRWPVVEYDDETVRDGIERLRAKRMALVIIGNGRVTKYSQSVSDKWNIGRRELGALCVLLLRGPQTLGEVKDRAERIFPFADLEETERTLEKMAQWPSGPLTMKLARQPGQKEARFAHLLAGEPALESFSGSAAFAGAAAFDGPPPPNRVALLEAEVQELKSGLADLKRRFDDLEAQLR